MPGVPKNIDHFKQKVKTGQYKKLLEKNKKIKTKQNIKVPDG